jgi:hypothetical protein
MKKIVFFIGLFLIGYPINSQQNLIKSEISPIKSNGYIKWQNFDPSGFRIRVFEKLSNGTFNEVERIETEKNYHKLNDSYLNRTKNYYRIEGKSSVALNDVIDDVIEPIRPPKPGEEHMFRVCSKVCNGNEYAYSLDSFGIGIATDSNLDGEVDVDENGDYILNETGKRFMRMSSAGFDYDNLQGDIAPYYIAMDVVDFNNYNELYKLIYGQYLQQNIDYIQYNGFVGTDAKFKTREGYNFHGSNPKLVEKRALQFEWMTDNRTPVLFYTDNLCSQPLLGQSHVGWIGTWNANKVYNGDDDIPGNQYNSNPNPSIYKSELECKGHRTISSGDLVDPEDLYLWQNQMYDDWFDCLDDWTENGYPDDLIDCGPSLPGGGFTGTGNPLPHWSQYVRKLLFVKVDNNDESTETPIEWNPGEKKEFYNPNNLILEAGLYKMYGIFSSGKVIPYYFEYKPEMAIIKKVSDFVKLEIIPNPIQNNSLKFDVSSDKKVKYNLEIHSLDGQVLMSESSFINENTTKNVVVNVSKNKYPYNQIRVVLKFEDGSQIEKIAYRAN